jgi:5'-nucleotidase
MAMRSVTTLRSCTLIFAVLTFAVAGCGDDGSHRVMPLRILVTNDDGVGAGGIDAIVEALASDPDNEVIVSAPDGNRSGSSDNTGPSALCGDLTVTTAMTLSGYAATAINGCPADAVNYALANLYPANAPPHLVISGINAGQNVSLPIATRVSGTVGAARTAARSGIPALAASQGAPPIDGTYDYASGVAAVLIWLEEKRSSLLSGEQPPADIDSINVPTCVAGTSIRGTVIDLPLAPNANLAFNTQDCASTLDDFQNDVEAFLNGYITRNSVPLQN